MVGTDAGPAASLQEKAQARKDLDVYGFAALADTSTPGQCGRSPDQVRASQVGLNKSSCDLGARSTRSSTAVDLLGKKLQASRDRRNPRFQYVEELNDDIAREVR
jgi:hypothetical protein